jgi:hypothetical protein
MLGNTVASQIQGEQISGDAHTRDMWPLQTWAKSHQAIVKEALAPQESYIEAVARQLLDRELGTQPVARHGSKVLSKKP